MECGEAVQVATGIRCDFPVCPFIPRRPLSLCDRSLLNDRELARTSALDQGRQPQRERRKRRLQCQHEEVGNDERNDAPEKCRQWNIGPHRVDDQDDETDRRNDEAEFDDDHVDDRPPDPIVAEVNNNRQRERQRDDHGRQLIKIAPSAR